MIQTTIHQIVGLQGMTLLVFYTEAQCFNARIISVGGSVFDECKLYYTPEAAKIAVRFGTLNCQNPRLVFPGI